MKEFKTIVIIMLITAALISGCEFENMDTRTSASMDKACIDGVVYYYYKHGIAPAYNTNGTLKLCNR